MHELFIKYLQNQCSPQEVKELLAHFNLSENHGELRKLINESLEIDYPDELLNDWNPALDKGLEEIKRQINFESPKVIPFYKQTWFRVAAILILLVGGFTIYTLLRNKGEKQDLVNSKPSKQENQSGHNKAILTLADGSTINLETTENGIITRQGNTKIEKEDGQIAYKATDEKSEVFLNHIATPKGGQYQLILADGSKVWLNAASNLRFPASFEGNERVVELEGEAYFEVAKNTSMPFKVKVDGKSEIQVLGTHFNVNAYSDEDAVNTTLLEGQVKVIVLASGLNKIINPGEQAQLLNNGEIKTFKNPNAEQSIAWKNGTFNGNSDLEKLMREIGRWYDVDIKYEGAIPKRQFEGEIQRDLKLQQVLKILERNNIVCRLQGKTLTVLK